MDIARTLGPIALVAALVFLSTQGSAALNAVPGEFLVKLKESASKDAKELISNEKYLGLALGGTIKEKFPGDSRLFLVSQKSKDIVRALTELNANELVEYAEANYIYTSSKAPNDPKFAKTWGMANFGQYDKDANRPGDPLPRQVGVKGVDIGVQDAWNISTGSSEVVVAILDTGIDFSHVDLSENAWVNQSELIGRPGVDDDGNGFVDDLHGYNFIDNTSDVSDNNSHGTHCAGIIGAQGNNDEGIAGVAWNVRLMSVKFLSNQATGSLANAIRSIDYAIANGAQIINSSWASDFYSVTLSEAIARAGQKNVLFVAAAGNESDDTDQTLHYPVSYNLKNIIAVAAIDNRGALSYFSNYGKTDVHVAAPGVNIYSTLPGNMYGIKSGTSMAAPYVSGVAALLKAQFPQMSASEIKNRIITTAQPLPSLLNRTVSGGRVDAFNALTNFVPAP